VGARELTPSRRMVERHEAGDAVGMELPKPDMQHFATAHRVQPSQATAAQPARPDPGISAELSHCGLDGLEVSESSFDVWAAAFAQLTLGGPNR